ncbi:pyruvate dehydrogenase (acetyl-transferring) E1 component subunit alpha [Saprospira sp. CCB-QB6]|uniref:pyruvate dehydrogenase (acetyl-transferring) E1 component subunit alpha n=1 Tax=Saprospira sp. CCB-QB6 TaxID=3023936 RepID=UPI00234BB9F2|nr:pyruvate dehydrogenase (acetyl-transferring) E1 component subunit alpha [Saprospira sp. CCB-QB6]WCL82397.1 pyruvate dehydrogenase (acetyl-transferring) E1 component subunit alpha [Saprospira sp. CCB-QB6]
MAKRKKKPAFSKEQYLSWYELMYLTRKFEEQCNIVYYQKKIRGFLHLCIGQEAIYAAMQSACRKEDSWITAYRVHGMALAAGISANETMAELYGKATGNVKGKGGSMHFFNAERNFYGGHGIVGGQIGLGAGIAFADKYKGNDNVTLALFGDGASRQGILHESFNMAMTWKLPVLFICENNKYAMGTSVERTSNVTNLHLLGESYKMPNKAINGMDVEVLHNELSEAIDYIRQGNGPMLLEIETYRYKGHSMSDPAKYRTKDEEKEYKEKDPIGRVEHILLENNMITEEELKEIQNRLKEEVKAAVDFAENSPLPQPEQLYEDMYVQEDYPFIKD